MLKRAEKFKRVLNKPKMINEIYRDQLETALHEHKRTNRGLFFSAISAGLEIGFSIFLMATLYSLFVSTVNPSTLHILLSIAYPLGFIFVILGKSELFTEHTTLAVIPVLNGNVSFKSLLRLLGIVYMGNLLGGYLFSFILTYLSNGINIITSEALVALATKFIDFRWSLILGSGILAGWLMGLLSWLMASSQDTISRIVIIFMITTVIGIGSLHHSIVGSIEVFTGMLLSDEITVFKYLKTQFWSTIGNLIGGIVFVSLVKFSHVNK